VSGTHWNLLTGEYPPKIGGVADYTRLLAASLALSGDRVDVWAPGRTGEELNDPGVRVHHLPDLRRRGLSALEEGLQRVPSPRRLFLQYVPHAFGRRGINVEFVRWVSSRTEELWVQFHEVALGWEWNRRPDLHVTQAVQLWMARAIARRADRIFISVEGWRRRLGKAGQAATWLPIPSNIPTQVSPIEVATVKRELGPGPWVGHFGTYGTAITRDLAPALRSIAASNGKSRILLLGRGASRFANTLALGERVRAADGLTGAAVATRLAACDLLVQPFPDGISARRTSAMAGLALGMPMASTDGRLTDPIWRTSQAVALAPAGQPKEFAGLCLDLLADPARCRDLGERAAALYAEEFSLERTRSLLRA
jgi:glycosyltransferase involved in cell wall biosynthesis